MKVVCIGDSITYGYGVDKSKIWVSLLSGETKYSVINKGIIGNTTSAMLERSYRDIICLAPEYVVILGGTNDLLIGLNESYVFENIKTLALEAKEHNVIPLIATPIPTCNNMAKKHWDSYIDYNEVNAHISNLGNLISYFCLKNSFMHVDLYNSFIEKSSDYPQLYLDGIHPAETGHKLIKDIFLSSFLPIKE